MANQDTLCGEQITLSDYFSPTCYLTKYHAGNLHVALVESMSTYLPVRITWPRRESIEALLDEKATDAKR